MSKLKIPIANILEKISTAIDMISIYISTRKK